MRRVEGRQASMRRVRARACAVEGHWSECGVCDKGIGGECGWADVLEQARRYNLARSGAGRGGADVLEGTPKRAVAGCSVSDARRSLHPLPPPQCHAATVALVAASHSCTGFAEHQKRPFSREAPDGRFLWGAMPQNKESREAPIELGCLLLVVGEAAINSSAGAKSRRRTHT